MRLTAFQSGKGDCLLLSDTAETTRILVDGGMPAAYSAHVAPTLGQLRASGKEIDLVYVSHIDQDHIGGVLRLLNDEVEWRVHDHQRKNGNTAHKAPKSPRPPKVRHIWHNAFHEQITKNAGEIEDALAAIAPVLSGADVAALREAGLRQGSLATSIREAIQVSRRVSPNQLKIPLNAPAKGKLMMLRNGDKPAKLKGGLTVTILGPTEKHLKKLRSDWNDWLRKNQEALKAIREKGRRDVERLGASEFDMFLAMLKLQSESFGNPNDVTPPNLASLTLLVEENGESVVLTGDARGDQIIEGLRSTGRLTDKTLSVDVMKVPHHGSENNIESEFVDTIPAKHYVFCGNGEHENPDLRVVEMMARRRLAAAGPFKFWFNSSSKVTEKAAAVEHMLELEKLVRRLAQKSKGRMTFKFMDKGSSFRVI
jgi:beta-lactamase superfamily II metal-dependent hydrolase